MGVTTTENRRKRHEPTAVHFVLRVGKAIINTDGIKAVVPELKQQGANLNQIGQKLSVTLNDLSSVWQSLGAALQTVRGTKK